MKTEKKTSENRKNAEHERKTECTRIPAEKKTSQNKSEHRRENMLKTEKKTFESREENEFICLHLNGSTSDDGLAAGLADGLVVGRRCVGGGPSRSGPASRIDQFPSSRKFLDILGQLLDAKVGLPWDPIRRAEPCGRL